MYLFRNLLILQHFFTTILTIDDYKKIDFIVFTTICFCLLFTNY